MKTALKATLAVAVIALGGTSVFGILGHARTPSGQERAQELARTSLAPWDPVEVYVRDHKLIIKADEGVVSESLYIEIIADGLCSNASTASSFAGIQEVRVLNRRGGRGYAYTRPLTECLVFKHRPTGDDRTTFDILSHTRMHSPNVLGM